MTEGTDGYLLVHKRRNQEDSEVLNSLQESLNLFLKICF